MDPESPGRRKRRSPCCGCVSCGCGVPLLALLVLLIVYTVNNRPPNLVIPTPTPPANNAYNDFVAASRVIKNIPHKAPASMVNPPTTRAGLLAASAASTKDAQPGFAILRRGFPKACQAPVHRTYETLGFQDMAWFREVERITSGARLYYELTNQPGKAADAALDGLELAVMFPNGGALMDALVGIACEAISLVRFEPLLPKLSKSELDHVGARLDAIIAKRPIWSGFLLEEGRSSTAMLQNLLRDPKNRGFSGNVEMLRTLSDPDGELKLRAKDVEDGIRFILTDKQQMLREHLRYYEHLADEAKQPFAGKSRVKAPDNMFTQMVAGLADGARPKWEANGAVLLLLRVEVALYRYRFDHGSFPATLAELAPVYIRSVPTDPFGGAAGKPFHYQGVTAHPGFLLYSLGPDMTDNHGRGGRFPTDPNCDIVAGYLWPRKSEY